MKKQNIVLTKVLGIMGSLVWCLAILLRGTSAQSHQSIDFLLGIAPNFGVALLFPSILISVVLEKYKVLLAIKKYIFVLLSFLTILITFELLHDLFLNSPFDINDIIASSLALGLMALSYSYEYKRHTSESLL